ncbi:hypothetical protein ACFXPT_31415, partial [Streptomyces goshikiensis]
EIAHRRRFGSRGGRQPAFDRETYKQRNTVERRINKLTQWRGLATRYDKTATAYQAGRPHGRVSALCGVAAAVVVGVGESAGAWVRSSSGVWRSWPIP